MSRPVEVSVTQSVEELKKLLAKCLVHQRPKVKMLLAILAGTHKNGLLAVKTGAALRSITHWKKTYISGGLQSLLTDRRGGDHRSSIDAAAKEQLRAKLHDPKDAFTSFGQAQAWIKEYLGVEMNYHAVNKYLKRNFGAKLKVGRKSHLQKDEAAVAVFKKPAPQPGAGQG